MFVAKLTGKEKPNPLPDNTSDEGLVCRILWTKIVKIRDSLEHHDKYKCESSSVN